MNNKLNNIILVTFDKHRADYPVMSFSVASILATLKQYQIPASHYSFDIKNFERTPEGYMPSKILDDLDDSISFLKKFSCIAIGVTRWSENFAYMLIRKLEDNYQGKIIVGGYEITAMKQIPEWLTDFNIQHYIQGYAEKALVKLMSGEYPENQLLIHENLDEDYLFSPYSSGVLSTIGRKIYWETKRGCRYNCGFCEWGNAQKDSVNLSLDTLNKDIEIFAQSNVEEINILDPTFNVQKGYDLVLQRLIENTNALITFQARFENLSNGFIDYCSKHNERVYLEFGLQTIHKNEMDVIGRSNNMALIEGKLEQLNKSKINYEVSIIYAIPGQTLTSFIDTIEFLRVKGCKKIMAYPLQVPENSQLKEKSEEYRIRYKEDNYYVKSVESSHSFDANARFDMDYISDNLTRQMHISNRNDLALSKLKSSRYLYEVQESSIRKHPELFKPLFWDFIDRPIKENGKDLAMKQPLAAVPDPTVSIFSDENIIKILCCKLPVTISVPNIGKSNHFKDIYCRLLVGESGFVYMCREIVDRNPDDIIREQLPDSNLVEQE